MRNILLAAFAVAALVAGATVAKADDFAGKQTIDGSYAYPYAQNSDQQAVDSQLSDPTARDSIRSHGNR